MVHNGEDAVKAIGKREFDNEVHSNSLKGEGGAVGGDGMVRNAGASGISLSSLAGGTTTDEGRNEVFHMGPPVVLCEEKTSFQYARVTCRGRIMI